MAKKKLPFDSAERMNSTLTTQELLSWVMNQLRRAARTIELLGEKKHVVASGCDLAADTIAIRMKTHRDGEHCPYCGAGHTRACIEGGRCIYCGTMLSAIPPKKKGKR